MPTVTLYHGLTDGPFDGQLRAPLYLAPHRDLAEAYAEDGGGTVVAVEVRYENPLVLATPQAFAEAWAESGAAGVIGPFHPDTANHFAQWARARGYDVVVLPDEAFDSPETGDDEADYAAWDAGPTGWYGDPQTILLDTTKARVL